MSNLPVWNQLSGYKLAELEERVTTTVNLPLDPSSADIITGFKPDDTALSSSPLPTLINSSDLSIEKTWTQTVNNVPNTSVTYTYPISIRIPTIPSLATKKVPVVIILHGNGGNGSAEITAWQNYLGDHIIIAPTGLSLIHI